MSNLAKHQKQSGSGAKPTIRLIRENIKLNPLAACIRAACLPASLALLTLPGIALAGPEGGEVVGGQGTISNPDVNTTLINQQSNNLSINWETFNISQQELVQFVQPSSTSTALNRIFDQNPSQIFGSIIANGNVILLNPSGVYFSPTASVNVNSLIASSLNLSDEDFFSGNYKFTAPEGQEGGLVVNQGVIAAATGGSVSLIGGAVKNEGVIMAYAGQVNLVAGNQVTMDFDGDGLMQFTVDKAILQNAQSLDSAVKNSGTIEAEGGTVLMAGSAAAEVFSNVVNNEGVIKAGRIDNEGGVVRLVGMGAGSLVLNTGTIDVSAISSPLPPGDNSNSPSPLMGEGGDGGEVAGNGGTIEITGTNITNTGTLSANSNGGNGGTIKLESTDTTIISANAHLSAIAPAITPSPSNTDSLPLEGEGEGGGENSNQGKGGTIHILGNKVALLDASSIDVSGALGGGTVLIGGDFQGKNPEIQNAARTYVGTDTSIKADAITDGDGGKVIVWADEITRFYGNISARGGAVGGDGGFAEVSGKETLDFFGGTVDLTADAGSVGTLLLDPKNITVSIANSGVSRTAAADLNAFTVNPTETSWITPADLVTLLNGAAVTFQANNDITFTDAVDTTAGNFDFTLEAGRSILVNANITIGGNFTATANIVNTAVLQVNRDPASAGVFTMADGTTISTTDNSGNGNITIKVQTGDPDIAADADKASGDITISNLNAGTGHVLIEQAGATAGSDILRTATSNISAASVALDISNVANTTGTIGLTGTKINTNVANLELRTQGGSAFINETDALIIGGATLGGLTGINTGSGNVSITAGAAVTQGATDTIVAAGLELLGTGPYTLTDAGNDVDTIAANTTDTISFRDNDGLTVGAVNTIGITTTNNNVSLQTNSSSITIDDDVSIGSGNLTLNGFDGSSQNAGKTITAAGLLLQGAGAGSHTLTDTGNDITTLAASTTNAVSFTNTDGFSVGTVNAVDGVSASTVALTANTGNLTVTNTGAGNDINASGGVTLTASATDADVIIETSAIVNNSTANGVTVRADDMDLSGTITASGQTVLLRPNANIAIEFGGTDGAAELNLTPAELNNVTAGTLAVGHSAAGAITVSTAIAPLGTNTLSLLTGGTVTQTNTIIETNLAIQSAGAVTLNSANDVDNLAANVTGATNAFQFTDIDALTIPATAIDGVTGITTNNGAITLSVGTVTDNSALTVSGAIASGGGAINLLADNMSIAASINAGAAGIVTLAPLTSAGDTNDALNLGGADAADVLGLTDIELDFVTALTLRTGSTAATGAITVSADISPGSITNLHLLNGANTITDAATITVSSLAITSGGAVTLNNANAIDTLAATLTGAGSSFAFQNETNGFTVGTVDSVTGITTANNAAGNTGGITLEADTGNILVNAAITTGIASSDTDTTSGAISITSTGGAIIGNVSGALTTGKATAATANTGDDDATSGSITLSATGAIQLAAVDALRTGDAELVDADNLNSDATPGNITISSADKVSSDGANGAVDVRIGSPIGTNTTTGTSANGVLAVTTDGGAGDAGGIFITSAEPLRLGVLNTDDVTSQNVNITVTSDNTFLTFGAASNLDSDIVTFTADDMDILATLTMTSGRIIAKPFQATDTIDLGATTNTANVLELSDVELDRFVTSTGVVEIGSTGGGAITVSADVTTGVAATGALHLKTGAGVSAASFGITETNLAITAAGVVNFGAAGTTDVTTLAISNNNTVTFVDDTGFTVGDVDGVFGIAGSTVSLTAGGNLTISNTSAVSGNDIDATGAITLNATANDTDVIISAGAHVESVTGGVTIIADNIDINATGTIDAGNGLVTLRPDDTGDAMQVGATAADGAGTLGITGAEIQNIFTSGGLTIGSATNSGTLTVVGAVTATNTQNITGGTISLLNLDDNIAINAAFNSSGRDLVLTSANSAVADGNIVFGAAGALTATGATATLTAVDGNIQGNATVLTNITATTVDLTAARGIGTTSALELAVQFISADNTDSENTANDIDIDNFSATPVSITGMTTINNDADNDPNTNVIRFDQTGGGTLTVNGTVSSGVNGSVNGGDITITNTGVGATLTVGATGIIDTRQGSGGTFSSSATLAGGSQIFVGAGDITLTGDNTDIIIDTNQIFANSQNYSANRDIIIRATLDVTGDITLTADFDGDMSGGVWIDEAGDADDAKLVATGSITLSGSDVFALPGTQESIQIDADGTNNQIQAGTGIFLSSGAAAPNDVFINIAGNITTSVGGVMVTADKMAITNTITATGQTVTLQNEELGEFINLGSMTDAAADTLELSDTELGNVLATTLRIGRNDASASGDVTISSAIDLTNIAAEADELSIYTGGTVIDNAALTVAGLAISAVNSVTLDFGHSIAELAAMLSGEGAFFDFLNETDGFAVDTVDGINGITTANRITIGGQSGDITLSTASGDISINQNVTTGNASATAIVPPSTEFVGSGDISITAGGSGVIKGTTGTVTTGSATLVNDGDLTDSDNAFSGNINLTANEISGDGTAGAAASALNVTIGIATAATGDAAFTGTLTATVDGSTTAGEIVITSATNLDNILLDTTDGDMTNVSITVTGDNARISINSMLSLDDDQVIFTADKMAVNNTVTTTGSVTLRPNEAGEFINLGSGTDAAPDTLELSDAELDNISASTLIIGRSTAGAISISAPIDTFLTSNLGLLTGSTISQGAAGSGFTITETNLALTAGDAITLNEANDVTTLAVSNVGNSVSFTDANGFSVGSVAGGAGGANVNGVSGTSVSLTATTGNLTVTNIVAAANDIDATGAVTLTASADEAFINISSSADVEADGGATLTADKMDLDGTITATGQVVTLKAESVFDVDAIDLGFATDAAVDVLELSDTELNNITAATLRVGATDAGAITISAAGVGPNNVTTNFSLLSDFGISQSVAGSITFNGGLRLDVDDAVALATNANDVNSLAANVSMAGQTFAFLDSDGLTITTVDTTVGVTTNNAQIDITAGGDDNTLTVSQAVASGGGAINLRADKMALGVGVNATGGTVTLTSANAGDLINLGSATDAVANTLELSDTELDNVMAGILRIGTATAGAITVSANVTTGASMLHLITNSGVSAASFGITETNLAISANGAVNFGVAGTTDVTTLAISNSNTVSFTDDTGFSVGDVDGVFGVSGTTVGLTAANGDLTITDTSAPSTNDINATGAVTLTATAADTDVIINDGANVETTTGGVTINADNINLNTTGTIHATGSLVTLRPSDNAQAIQVGAGAVDGATLGLTEAELQNIFTTGGLTIGSTSQTGTITVVGAADITNVTGGTVSLLTDAADILVNAALTTHTTTTLTTASTTATATNAITFGASGEIDATGFTATLNAGGNITVEDITASTIALNVDTGANGAQTLTINGTLTGTASADGQGTNDTLVAPNVANTFTVNALNGGTLASMGSSSLSFTNFANLTGGTNNDTFIFTIGTLGGDIDGGTGTNRINIAAVGGAHTINLQTATISGGLLGGTFSNIEAFTGDNTADILVGTDAATVWTITGPNDGTLDTGFSFIDMPNLTGGTDDDTFTFAAAGSLTGTINGAADTTDDRINIAAKAGANSIDLQLGTISGGFLGSFSNVEAFTGDNLADILVGTNAATTWTINGVNDGTLDTGFSFIDMPNLTGGTAADNFTLTGAGNITGIITGGGTGIDTVTGDNEVNAWSITGAGIGTLTDSAGANAFTGIENLTGGTGIDTFNITTGSIFGLISGNAAASVAVDTLSYAGGPPTATITLTDVGSLDGFQGDATSLGTGPTSPAFDNIDAVIGSGGTDTLTGLDTVSNWDIDGSNTYTDTVSGNILNFSAFETLIGGDDNDIFNLSIGFAGSINGGDGANAFNFLAGNVTASITSNSSGTDILTADSFNFLGGTMGGSVILNGNATWNPAELIPLTSLASGVTGPATSSLQIPASGAVIVCGTPCTDTGSFDLNLSNFGSFSGHLIVGGTLDEIVPSLADPLLTTITPTASSLSIGPLITDAINTGGNLTLLGIFIDITNDVTAGGELGIVSLGGGGVDASAGLVTLTATNGLIVTDGTLSNTGNMILQFGGGTMEVATTSSVGVVVFGPGSNATGASTPGLSMINLLNLLVGFTTAQIQVLNPAADLIGLEELGFIDTGLFEQDLTLFGVIGNGIALALAQCEEIEGCAPNVTEEELNELIAQLEARIAELEKRCEDGDTAACGLLEGYREELGKFMAYREELQQYLTAGTEEELGDEFTDEFGAEEPATGKQASINVLVRMLETVKARIQWLESLLTNAEERARLGAITGIELTQEALNEIIEGAKAHSQFIEQQIKLLQEGTQAQILPSVFTAEAADYSRMQTVVYGPSLLDPDQKLMMNGNWN